MLSYTGGRGTQGAGGHCLTNILPSTPSPLGHIAANCPPPPSYNQTFFSRPMQKSFLHLLGSSLATSLLAPKLDTVEWIMSIDLSGRSWNSHCVNRTTWEHVPDKSLPLAQTIVQSVAIGCFIMEDQELQIHFIWRGLLSWYKSYKIVFFTLLISTLDE